MSFKEKLKALVDYGNEELRKEESRLRALGYHPLRVIHDLSHVTVEELIAIGQQANLDIVDLSFDGRIHVWIKKDCVEALKTLVTIARQTRTKIDRIDEHTRRAWNSLHRVYGTMMKDGAVYAPSAQHQLGALNKKRAQYDLPSLKDGYVKVFGRVVD